MSRLLSSQFTPQVVTLTISGLDDSLCDVTAELSALAERDSNRCHGYFPGMGGKVGINLDLPECQKFAEAFPELELNEKTLRFNFLRMSLIDQPSVSPFHLDTDSATALTGDIATMDKRLVWRLLINLSPDKSRSLIYLDVDPESIDLKNERGYVACPSDLVDETKVRSAVLRPRNGDSVSALLFCASRVLHAGKDTGGGHFVAGYGIDEDI